MKKCSKLLCAILTVCMMLTILPLGALAENEAHVSFTDTNGHWAEKYITYWANTLSKDGTQYVIGGYPDGSFMPDANITRGAVAAILNRAIGFQVNGSTVGFADVREDNVFYKHIIACADNGVIKGYLDGTFRPGNSVTRQAAVALISRCMMTDKDYQDYSSDFQCQSILRNKFSDAGDISSAFYPELCYMISKGSLEGYPDGSIRPSQPITRAQFVKLLSTLVASEEKDPDVPPVVSDKTYKLSVIITDGERTFSDSVDELNGDVKVTDAIMSVVCENSGELRNNFTSEKAKDTLNALVALYDINRSYGWTDRTKLEWGSYVNKSFASATGDNTIIYAFANVETTLSDLGENTYVVNVDGFTIAVVISAY